MICCPSSLLSGSTLLLSRDDICLTKVRGEMKIFLTAVLHFDNNCVQKYTKMTNFPWKSANVSFLQVYYKKAEIFSNMWKRTIFVNAMRCDVGRFFAKENGGTIFAPFFVLSKFPRNMCQICVTQEQLRVAACWFFQNRIIFAKIFWKKSLGDWKCLKDFRFLQISSKYMR